MENLTFETGVEEFDLNGKTKVCFNPTDSFFVEKLYKTFEQLDAKQEQRKEEISKMAGNKEIFDYSRSMDAEMRAMIDDLFGAPISDAVFEGMNVYSMASGLPVWCNLMLAIMDTIDSTFSREQKATNPRVQKYTAKYHK